MPAASFTRIVGSCSSLLTTPCVIASIDLARGGVERCELRSVSLELERAELFGPGAQRGDERCNLPRRPVEPVTVELLGDEVAHLADLLAALCQRVLAERAQVVDVEEVDTEHLARPRIDVAGHAHVDDEQRATAAALHHLFDLAAFHEQVGGAGGHEQHVALDERGRHLVEGDRTPADPAREFLAARQRAVGDDDLEHAGAGEGERHALTHLARAEHEHARSSSVPRRLFASDTAADDTDTACRPIAVSVRARLPTSIAWRNVRESNGPLASSRSAACHASRTWPRISPSPMIIESRPAATPNRCATAASSW